LGEEGDHREDTGRASRARLPPRRRANGRRLAIAGDEGDAAGFDVAHGRLAEEAAVLAIELAGAFVADFKCCAGGIETVVEHALPRDM